MATAYGYTTAKRHNSTLQPTGGTSIDVELKGGCDLNSPLFLLNHSGVPTYSMISFEGRYYFVDSIRSVRNNLWELQCSVDVLATYKTNIKAITAFVKYYSHSNTEVSDLRLATKTTKSVQVNEGVFDVLGSISGTSGTIVLMVTGKGNVGAYAIAEHDPNGDIEDILNSVDLEWDTEIAAIDFTPLQTANDVVDWLTKFGRILGDWVSSIIGKIIYSGNAIDNIKSAHMLPLPKSSVGSSNTLTLLLGNFNTGTTVNKIDDRIFSDGATVSIPWQASDWRRNAPYHELYLYIPYVGLIQLSPSELIGETTLHVSAQLDKLNGDTIFTVTTGSGTVIGQYSANLASNFPIGSSNVPTSKELGGVITSAAGLGVAVATAVTGGAAGAILAGASAAGVGLVNAITPVNTTISGASGAAALGLTDRSKVKCISTYHDTIQGPHSISAAAGEPYNGAMSLSGISGYVQTVAASVSGAMTDTEREEVNRLLDGGIYIE